MELSIGSSPLREIQYIISPRFRRITNYLGSLFSEGECGSRGNGCAGDLHKDWKLALQVNNIFLKTCEGLYRHSHLGHLPCTFLCPHKYKQDLSKELFASSQTFQSPPRPPPTHFLNGTFQSSYRTTKVAGANPNSK